MKYRIKYNDPTNDGWLWFTPFVIFAFLAAFIGVKGKWVIEQKKHWWNNWKVIEVYDNAKDAHIKYFKLKHNLDIQKRMQFTHNRYKNKTVWCELEFKFNNYSKEYKYCVGYKPKNYARYYFCTYSSESYEDALIKLWCDLEVRKLIKKI